MRKDFRIWLAVLVIVRRLGQASRVDESFHEERGIGTLLYFEAESGRDLAVESVHLGAIDLLRQEGSCGDDIGIAETSQAKVQVFQNLFYV